MQSFTCSHRGGRIHDMWSFGLCGFQWTNLCSPSDQKAKMFANCHEFHMKNENSQCPLGRIQAQECLVFFACSSRPSPSCGICPAGPTGTESRPGPKLSSPLGPTISVP